MQLSKADRQAWWASLSPEDQALYVQYAMERKRAAGWFPGWQEWRAERIEERLDAELAERVGREA